MDRFLPVLGWLGAALLLIGGILWGTRPGFEAAGQGMVLAGAAALLLYLFLQRREIAGTGSEWWTTSRTFLSEVRNELKRVTWPTRKEVYATTIVVILTSIFFGLYLWGVDLVLNAIVARIFTTFGAA
jgi:preprotein translocase subunit SecE